MYLYINMLLWYESYFLSILKIKLHQSILYISEKTQMILNSHNRIYFFVFIMYMFVKMHYNNTNHGSIHTKASICSIFWFYALCSTCTCICINIYNIECDTGKYGKNCLQNCGHCKQRDQCHYVNGFCVEGCSAGYNGSLCIKRK